MPWATSSSRDSSCPMHQCFDSRVARFRHNFKIRGKMSAWWGNEAVGMCGGSGMGLFPSEVRDVSTVLARFTAGCTGSGRRDGECGWRFQTVTCTLVGSKYPRSSVTALTSSGASPSASKPPAMWTAQPETTTEHWYPGRVKLRTAFGDRAASCPERVDTQGRRTTDGGQSAYIRGLPGYLDPAPGTSAASRTRRTHPHTGEGYV